MRADRPRWTNAPLPNPAVAESHTNPVKDSCQPISSCPIQGDFHFFRTPSGVCQGLAQVIGFKIRIGLQYFLLGAAGRTEQEILKAYPYLEPDDLREALAYAAWRAEEVEIPLNRA